MLQGRLLGQASSPGLSLNLEAATPDTGAGPSSRPGGTSLPQRSLHPPKPSTNGVTLEELVWYDRTVVWSTGNQVHRIYTFEDEHEDEQVLFALFANFQLGSSSSSRAPAPDQYQGNGKGKGRAKDDQTFGPFFDSQYAQWGGPTLPAATPTSPGNERDRRLGLERTLMVFLKGKAYIYFPSGEEVAVHLPFVVDHAWSMPSGAAKEEGRGRGGVLVQRALEKREVRRMARHKRGILGGLERNDGAATSGIGSALLSRLDELVDIEDDQAEELPRLWTLQQPFDEFKAVFEGYGSTGHDEHNAASIPIASSIVHFVEDPYPYPLVLMYDGTRGEVVFYQRHLSPTTTQSQSATTVAVAPAPAALTTRTMRPEDVLRQTESLPVPPAPAARLSGGEGRPSLHRNPSSFAASTSADRHISGKADPLDRNTRRAPRHSRGGTTATDREAQPGSLTGDLHAALDPPPFGTAISAPTSGTGTGAGAGRPRGVSGAGGVGGIGPSEKKDNRRTSGASAFMRQDMNDPLGSGKTGLHAMGEKDLRETTMMMGLEREETVVRSEMVLARIFTWSPPPSTIASSIKAFISDNISPSRCTVNLVIADTLHIFDLNFSPSLNLASTRSIPCLAAIPILSTRHAVRDTLVLLPDHQLQIITSFGQAIPFILPQYNSSDGRDEVAKRMASSLSMVLDEEDLSTDTGHGPGIGHGLRVVGLEVAWDSYLVAIYEDGETVRVSADFRVQDSLVRQCLQSLSLLLPAQEMFAIKIEVLSRAQAADTQDSNGAWTAFACSIVALFSLPSSQSSEFTPRSRYSDLVSSAGKSNDPSTRRLAAKVQSASRPAYRPHPPNPTSSSNSLDPSAVAPILLALHLVGQDCRLTSASQKHLIPLAELIIGLAAATGQIKWYEYWMRLVPTASAQPLVIPSRPTKSMLDNFESPPDVVTYLSISLARPCKQFPTPESLTAPGQVSELGPVTPCKATQLVVELYRRLCVAAAPSLTEVQLPPSLQRAYRVLEYMVGNGCTEDWLASLQYGVAIPILECVRLCQQAPAKGWTAHKYNFIGRADLAAQAQSKRDGRATYSLFDKQGEDDLPTIGKLMELKSASTDGNAHSDLPHVRFGSDRRLQEVERIMQTTRVRTITIEDPKGASEQEVLQYHQTVVNTVSHRTLAITVGKGIFDFGTRKTRVTQVWDIPLIELSIKVIPGNSIVKAQLVAENADWPCFHNGVAAALSISPDCTGIDSSWIVFNRPHTLNPEHGGFLLGLGLTGHLRHLHAYHAFPYLEPRHDYTSCGLILGLGCAFAGSQDLLIAKVLSLHTHALLPLGSMELNASPIIQSSALLGLGLIYAGSRNLRMAEVALAEIARREMQGVDSFTEYTEAYSLSASMAFGLIMLGRGGQHSSEVDRRLLSRLRKLILGDPSATAMGTIGAMDVTVTAPGATVALGLMYLRTGRRDIADMLHIPQTALDLELVRPDVLLLRTFARGLIMWDEVNPSLGWIEDQFPPFIQAAHKGHKKSSTMELASELAYFHILAGACFAIGLKYSGTATELAHNNLMLFFGVLTKAAASQSMTYEGKIRRNAARQCLNIVTISLAVIMSGTGELNLLRRLRVSHGQEGAGVTYGTHMASHIACGILFLGQGHYTLGNSNIAIAAMTIAFFPRFQASPGDNKAYPQAFRHLWAMAVEPRCLIARDVNTDDTVYLPVKVRLQEGDVIRQQSLISPTLIAPFDSLISIEVDSPRYWPVTYDLSNPLDRENLVRTRTIYVKRKAGYLDYNSDPKGNRSIFVRAGSMAGFDVYYDLISPAAPQAISATEVTSLIAAHSASPYYLALTKFFASSSGGGGQALAPTPTTTPLDAFIRNVLLECVSLDKPKLISIYLSMYLAMHSRPELKIDHMAQIELLQSFYSGEVYDKHFIPVAAGSTPMEKRPGWLRTSFIAAVGRRLASGPADENEKWEYFSRGLWPEQRLALGVYLRKNRVPPMELVQLARERVMSAGANGESADALVFKVREAARRYAHAVNQVPQVEEGAESHEVGSAASAWKKESVREVVAMWRG